MDVSTVVRACLRCWYVVAVVLAGTAYLASGFYQQAQPEYSVSASVLVVPSSGLQAVRAPDSPTGGSSTNPFGSGNGSSTLANALSQSLGSIRVQTAVVPPGAGLAATWDTEASSAVALRTVGLTAAEAETAMTTVLSGLDQVLADVQTRAGATPDQLYVTSVLAEPDFPQETFPDRLRTVVATMLAGTVFAVVLAVLLDGVLARRRTSRHLAPSPRVDGGDRLDEGPWDDASDGDPDRFDETRSMGRVGPVVRSDRNGDVERLISGPLLSVPQGARQRDHHADDERGGR